MAIFLDRINRVPIRIANLADAFLCDLESELIASFDNDQNPDEIFEYYCDQVLSIRD